MSLPETLPPPLSRAGKSLKEMQDEVVSDNTERGWYDKPVSFLEAMALLHTEVAEASEAWREHGTDDFTGPVMWNRSMTSQEMVPSIPKPEGVGSEFADVLIRLLDDCARFGIDLQFEYERKMKFNRTRPYRHGKRM